MSFMKLMAVAAVLFAPLWPMDIEPFPGEPYLFVNKANNELGWAEKGELVDVYKVATGREAEDTPEGTFTITVKAKEPYYRAEDIEGGNPENPLGSRWIGFDAKNTNGRVYGVHGTNNPASIGSYVSLGCIRMQNEEVNKLYEQVPLGTKIWIGHEPEKEMHTIAREAGVLRRTEG